MTDIILEPKFKDFKEKYENGIPQIVGFKFSSNDKTIISSYLKTSRNNKNSFLNFIFDIMDDIRNYLKEIECEELIPTCSFKNCK